MEKKHITTALGPAQLEKLMARCSELNVKMSPLIAMMIDMGGLDLPGLEEAAAAHNRYRCIRKR